jgi:hypothetical protein
MTRAQAVNNLIWGSSYALKSTSALAINEQNILNTSSMDTGVSQVKNYIILKENSVTDGFNVFRFSGTAGNHILFTNPATSASTLCYFELLRRGTLVNYTGTMYDMITQINGSTYNTDVLKCTLVKDETDEDAILIEAIDGADLRDYGIRIACGVEKGRDTNFPPTNMGTWPASSLTVRAENGSIWEENAEFFDQRSVDGYVYWVQVLYLTIHLAPYGDNQVVRQYDTTSINKYGKQILSIENFNMVDSATEKRAILANQLASYKDPKQRLSINVPFDYSKELYEYNRVQIQIPKRYYNGNEVGNYLAWTNGGGYRYKEFYINGISHNQDGVRTSLKLIEAL